MEETRNRRERARRRPVNNFLQVAAQLVRRVFLLFLIIWYQPDLWYGRGLSCVAVVTLIVNHTLYLWPRLCKKGLRAQRAAGHALLSFLISTFATLTYDIQCKGRKKLSMQRPGRTQDKPCDVGQVEQVWVHCTREMEEYHVQLQCTAILSLARACVARAYSYMLAQQMFVTIIGSDHSEYCD